MKPKRNDGDYIYKRNSKGEVVKFRRDSQIVTDENGDLKEVEKGSFAYTDSDGKTQTKKHDSSAPKPKTKNPPPFGEAKNCPTGIEGQATINETRMDEYLEGMEPERLMKP